MNLSKTQLEKIIREELEEAVLQYDKTTGKYGRSGPKRRASTPEDEERDRLEREKADAFYRRYRSKRGSVRGGAKLEEEELEEAYSPEVGRAELSSGIPVAAKWTRGGLAMQLLTPGGKPITLSTQKDAQALISLLEELLAGTNEVITMKLTKAKLEEIVKEELSERVFPQRPAHREATPEDMAALAALEKKPDEEGRMSKATLRRASEDAELINSMIREQEQLPAWVQEHISLAAENLQSVKQYMQSLRMYEQKEKVSLIP